MSEALVLSLLLNLLTIAVLVDSILVEKGVHKK